jgi:hypothetical protein
MPSYDYRRPEAEAAPPAAGAQTTTDAWGNAFAADLLGLAGAAGETILGDWWREWIVGDGASAPETAETGIAEAAAPFLADPCAEPPLFPIDPAQREAQGLPPSAELPAGCRVPDEPQPATAGPLSDEQRAAIEEERRKEALGENRGRSRGGGGDSIRWRTRDPNHPSPYPPPTQWRAPVR